MRNKLNVFTYKQYRNKQFIIQLISNIFLLFCTIFAIFCVVFSFQYESAPVDGFSMQPTLNTEYDNQHVVYIHKNSDYTYGDIIVVHKSSTENGNKYIIKRVIGLPGDKISYRFDTTDQNYYLYRNNERLNEDYLLSQQDVEYSYDHFSTLATKGPSSERINFSSIDGILTYTVPNNKVFVLGDNRKVSLDSSSNGSYSMDKVLGKVEYIEDSSLPYVFFIAKHFFTLKIFA